ncbi:hypothetical protein AGR1C_Cc50382 [Agrobacterium fabacearum TT111]|nr:hypothetical protein AGR1C_Cc50382 [Agrobacterium fabacearum TT111]
MTAAPVAQLDRVLDSDSKGHRFESCRVRHFIAEYGIKNDLENTEPNITDAQRQKTLSS